MLPGCKLTVGLGAGEAGVSTDTPRQNGQNPCQPLGFFTYLFTHEKPHRHEPMHSHSGMLWHAPRAKTSIRTHSLFQRPPGRGEGEMVQERVLKGWECPHPSSGS